MGIAGTLMAFHLRRPVITWTVGCSETGSFQLLMDDASFHCICVARNGLGSYQV
jgi:hypothetical protein